MGVNQFQAKEKESVAIHSNDPQLEKDQVSRLKTMRSHRDTPAAADSLTRLESAARTQDNLLPHIIRAVEAYASVGDISVVFRMVHGEYREAPVS